MKGIIFTEFMELVEREFGLPVLDQIILQAQPESGCVYTSTGAYPHTELVDLVTALAEKTGVPVNDLLLHFGQALFSALVVRMPWATDTKADCFDFLSSVDSQIHMEVEKLYPDAELPQLDFEAIDDRCAVMRYESSRPFAKVAEGLLRGCSAYYGDAFSVKLRDPSGETGEAMVFELRRIDADPAGSTA